MNKTQDREHLLEVTGSFQRNIVGLLCTFEVIANKALLARNELGNYIVAKYGGNDREGLEAIKERALDKRSTEHEKDYAELVNLIMKLE